MQMAGRDPKKLTVISKEIHSVMKEIKDLNGSASESKLSELESFIGSSAPEQIDILPRKQCNTKGSGKRSKREKEKAVEQQVVITRCVGPTEDDFQACKSQIYLA